MSSLRFGLLVVLSCWLLVATSCQEVAISRDLQIVDASRDIDLTSQLVRESTKFEFENTGSSPLDFFVFVVHHKVAKNLAHLQAIHRGKEEPQKLKVTKVTVSGLKSDDSFYRLDFVSPLAPGQKQKIEVDSVFAHGLSPFPSHISQSEQQFVVYEGNIHVLSPYPVKKEKTSVKVGGGSVESFTKEAPTKHDGEVVVYGPYESSQPFSFKATRIHFENNSPFLTVTKMTRLVEVSHWGNVAVEEHFEMVHSGAKLKGAFSRFDFQRDRRDRMPAVQSFKTLLPAAARDVYYRDEIGNISTSHLRPMEDAVELDIRPRFPLFGGWKTNYYIGYNLPSYEYIFNSGNKYVLNMRFLDHILDNFLVEELTLKVILPEGCKNMKLNAPFKLKRSPDEVHKTYLDTTGRPVVVAQKANLVDEHIQDFQLEYIFERSMMIWEPLMIIVAFYLLFLVVIVWVRLDFAISKDASSESRMKVAGLVDEAGNVHSQRMNAYDTWSEAIAKAKTAKESASLAAAKKKAETSLKQLAQQMSELQVLLKAESPETADKVAEGERLEKSVREQHNAWTQQTERLLSGKMQKAAFGDAEKLCRAKIDELRDKLDNLIFTL